MVVLKKLYFDCRIKGATLIETLVATVLIVFIFMLASMILNNLFSNTIFNSTQAVENHLYELQYLEQHEQLELPYTETYQNWNVNIENFKENDKSITEFEAINLKTNKTISFTRNAD